MIEIVHVRIYEDSNSTLMILHGQLYIVIKTCITDFSHQDNILLLDLTYN